MKTNTPIRIGIGGELIFQPIREVIKNNFPLKKEIKCGNCRI